MSAVIKGFIFQSIVQILAYLGCRKVEIDSEKFSQNLIGKVRKWITEFRQQLKISLDQEPNRHNQSAAME